VGNFESYALVGAKRDAECPEVVNVADLLTAQGLSNRDIAQRLYLSQGKGRADADGTIITVISHCY
jgi:hypothetical protein